MSDSANRRIKVLEDQALKMAKLMKQMSNSLERAVQVEVDILDILTQMNGDGVEKIPELKELLFN